MSRFDGRDRAALLVIDVQQDVVAQAWRRAEVIANIASLLAKARAQGTAVIWVQHADPWLIEGSPDWQIVPELDPRADEPRIGKRFRSSFEDTALDDLLARLGVGHLYLCGAQTNYCVRHTTHAALERGYDVTLVSDAHTTLDEALETGTVPAAQIVAEQNRACRGYELPGRSCRVVPTGSVAFAP